MAKSLLDIDDKHVLSDKENRGDAVQRENHVHGFNRNQGKKQRRNVVFSVFLDKEMLAVDLAR